MVLDDTELLDQVRPRWRTIAIPADDPSAGSAARWLVRFTLQDWGLEALADDVELCASELLANAINHAIVDTEVAEQFRGKRITLVLRAWPCWLFLEVSDEDSRPLPLLDRGDAPLWQGQRDTDPAGDQSHDAGEPELLATHGRGLQIVQTLADELSWLPKVGGGKTVFAKFDTSGLAA